MTIPDCSPVLFGVPMFEPGSWRSQSSLRVSWRRTRSQVRWVDCSASHAFHSTTSGTWLSCLITGVLGQVPEQQHLLPYGAEHAPQGVLQG